MVRPGPPLLYFGPRLPGSPNSFLDLSDAVQPLLPSFKLVFSEKFLPSLPEPYTLIWSNLLEHFPRFGSTCFCARVGVPSHLLPLAPFSPTPSETGALAIPPSRLWGSLPPVPQVEMRRFSFRGHAVKRDAHWEHTFTILRQQPFFYDAALLSGPDYGILGQGDVCPHQRVASVFPSVREGSFPRP